MLSAPYNFRFKLYDIGSLCLYLFVNALTSIGLKCIIRIAKHNVTALSMLYTYFARITRTSVFAQMYNIQARILFLIHIKRLGASVCRSIVNTYNFYCFKCLTK